RGIGGAGVDPPFGRLEGEHSPVGLVVVDDKHALALQLGLDADKVALPRRRQRGGRRLNAEMERGPTTWPFALGPQAPAHQLGKAPADGKPETRATVLASGRRVGLR